MLALRKAVIVCLVSSFCCFSSPFSLSADAAPKASAPAGNAVTEGPGALPQILLGPDGMPLDASWEQRYVNDTRTTIEKGVKGMMSGLGSTAALKDSVEMFCRTWDDWAQSKLFQLEHSRDIDVYGNLYSLAVMCRTLRLASEDWLNDTESAEAQAVFNKALWLESRSRRLADPVGEIIKNQSYSSFLPRRVEIMEEQFKYVDACYARRPFRPVAR